ncbi:MAG: hypothetical protein RSA01_08030 [Clostridium sp.]|uniref:hypothetical protein n=1 Tax=Clostridium sp. TaxID=1506 RepID=UPI002FCBF669
MGAKFKERLKLFGILEAVLIPGVLVIAFIFSLVKGSKLIEILPVFYYGVGAIVLVTAIPSLYRRPYVQKGMYRKIMGDMISFKHKGFEETFVETKSYEDDNPFATGLFIVLVGVVLLAIGYIIEGITFH